MDKTKRIELAADTITGVYRCANDDCEKGAEILFDDDFYDELSSVEPGTIYGNVSEEIANKIEIEYGIHQENNRG